VNDGISRKTKRLVLTGKDKSSMKEFQDKVAVVTGAAGGIGRALAGKCAALGMNTTVALV
jgi:FlaA1/EpsC-like NDP-sugar epimerase